MLLSLAGSLATISPIPRHCPAHMTRGQGRLQFRLERVRRFTRLLGLVQKVQIEARFFLGP